MTLREATDAVGRDHAMARDDDGQAVAAARLADGARVRAEVTGDIAIGSGASAWNGAHRVPHRALQAAAFH